MFSSTLGGKVASPANAKISRVPFATNSFIQSSNERPLPTQERRLSLAKYSPVGRLSSTAIHAITEVNSSSLSFSELINTIMARIPEPPPKRHSGEWLFDGGTAYNRDHPPDSNPADAGLTEPESELHHALYADEMSCILVELATSTSRHSGSP